MFANLQFIEMHFNLVVFIMLSCSLSLIMHLSNISRLFHQIYILFEIRIQPTGFRDSQTYRCLKKNKDFAKTFFLTQIHNSLDRVFKMNTQDCKFRIHTQLTI